MHRWTERGGVVIGFDAKLLSDRIAALEAENAELRKRLAAQEARDDE